MDSDRPLKHLPLFVFLVLYGGTFLLGATLLLLGPAFFVRLFARTVGIKPFWLDAQDVFSNWLLILGAPVLFVGGWIAASWRERDPDRPAAPALGLGPVIGCYAASLALAAVSLVRAGALVRIGAWLDYGALVQARFLLFDRLSFVEWTNIYMIIPVTSGLLSVNIWRGPWTARWRRLAVVAIGLVLIAVELLVYQKRYVVLSLIYLAACAAVNSPGSIARGRRGLLRVAAACGIAYVSYCALLVAPQLRIAPSGAIAPSIKQGDTSGLLRTQGTSPGARIGGAVAPPVSVSVATIPPARPRTYYTEIRRPLLKSAVDRLFPGRWIGTLDVGASGGGDTFLGRFVFALLSPVTRTPPPALAYPALFPRVLPLFGLDVAADLLGIGRMPDDNLIVYGAMYGQLDKGATSVPFQYCWFSQIGLFGALMLCFPLGAACAAAWRAALTGAWPPEVRAALGALVVLFCVGISQDSFRGSLLNSYGVAWGGIVVLGIWTAFRSRPVPVRPGRP